MAVEFIAHTFRIPAAAGRRQVEETIVFNDTVTSVQAALKGFFFEFADHDDHPLRLMEVLAFISGIDGNSVRVGAVCQFGDSNLDDPYVANVEVLVIANTQ